MKKIFNEIMADLPRWMKFLGAFSMGAIFGGIMTFLSFDNPTEYQEDNLAEEIVEGVLEHYTGQDIDLSPDSPEIRFPIEVIKTFRN